MYNEIIVNDCFTKETIYQYLKRNGFSENYIRQLRKQRGYILKNNQIAYTNDHVKHNDILKLIKNPNTSSGTMLCIIPLDIVYEDDDILVVNKPSGMPTIPSRRHLNYNLAGAVANYMQNKNTNFIVRIVNRLDKDTAGLVCIAKHSLIANLLNSGNNIQKTYYAICSGEVEKEYTINKNITTTLNSLGYNNQRREISENGKPAVTYVKRVLFDGTNSLCEIKLKFGRTHQIRLHMSSINHPLLGDTLYGHQSNLISHTALACLKMTIFNPLSNKTINLSVGIPSDFKNALTTDINMLNL